MSKKTKIEWTDTTWNPLRGCTKISPGCKNCYAATFAERWRGIPGHPFEQGFDLRLVPSHLEDPLKWKEPRKIFVNSMSDLFHEDVPVKYISAIVDVMLRAPQHTFQVLTKRAGRMAEMLAGELHHAANAPHIWWGVSVEDKKHGLPRIRQLQAAPAKCRFLSCEPLLEDLGHIDLNQIDWVIVGGESGPRARLVEATWIRSIRDQCHATNTPFFFKQWGGRRKWLAGNELDGKVYHEFPVEMKL